MNAAIHMRDANSKTYYSFSQSSLPRCLASFPRLEGHRPADCWQGDGRTAQHKRSDVANPMSTVW